MRRLRRGFDDIAIDVQAIMVGDDGRVLMVQGMPEPESGRGLWRFPAGNLAHGQTTHQSLMRYLHEMLGIGIEVEESLPNIEYLPPKPFEEIRGEHCLLPTHICRLVSGTPTILKSQQYQKVEWFALNMLPEWLTPVTMLTLVTYREYTSTRNNARS